jgi:hypothetical protein
MPAPQLLSLADALAAGAAAARTHASTSSFSDLATCAWDTTAITTAIATHGNETLFPTLPA